MKKGDYEPIAIWANHIGLAGFAKDYFPLPMGRRSTRKKTDINASSKMKVDEPNTVIIISSLTDAF